MTTFRKAWLLLVLITGASLHGASRDFWISPSGDDANPGTRTRPLRTLEAARDRVRQLRVEGQFPRRGVTVWLRGGVHARTNTFELTEADGGAVGAPVAYRGVPGERVLVAGGKAVRFQPLADPAVESRLSAEARGRVMVADLPLQGVTDFGQLVSRGFGRPLAPAHLELFCGGRPMTLARWPNEGEWAMIAGFPESTARPDDHGGKIGDLQGGFGYAGDRPRRWKNRRDIWVHGYWAWDWANSYERVDRFEDEQHLLFTAPPHGLYGFRKGQRFYFLNVFEELDAPGEYYVDRQTGRLYFWPPAGAPDGGSMVSVMETPLLQLRGVSHVVVRGLELVATRGLGIRVEGGLSNRVEACWLHDIGNTAVSIVGGRGHVVAACDVEDTGDGGVAVSGGDRRDLSVAGHRVENCHFQRQGRWSKCYVPAILMEGVGVTAVHNLIHEHPHCAILFSGNEHLIQYNEIHHVALETGDVGAIYTGRDWTYRGNRILNNYIHETGGVGMGSMGVYMDDCVSGTEIVGNVFYRVQRAAFLGGGRDHRVENNVFVECRPSVAIDGRGLDPSPVWHNMVYQFMKSRLAEMPAALYRERYPALRDLDTCYQDEKGIPPEGNTVRRNISVDGPWLEIGWHAKPQMVTVEDNLVDKDPGFQDAARQDYRLRRDSAAWQLGFREIPVKRIGLLPDALREELGRLRRSK